MMTYIHQKLHIPVWIMILVATGAFFRIREATSDVVDSAIFLQLSFSTLAFILTAPRILQYQKLYDSLKLVLFYIIAAGISSVFSPQPKLVLGYWMLFTGTILLTADMVFNSNQQQKLENLEDIWFFIVSFIILYNSMISLFFVQHDLGDQVYRLGHGSMSINSLSFTAIIAFWISFKYKNPLIRILRFMLLGVIFLTQTRITIASLVLVWMLRKWIHPTFSQNSPKFLSRCIYIFLFLGFLSAIWLSINFQAPGTQQVLEYFQRDKNPNSIRTLSGRTEIWPAALHHIFDNPTTFIFGHGYGTSKYILNEGEYAPEFYVYHAHNLYLETLLSIGLIGFIPMILLVFTSVRWIAMNRKLLNSFSMDYVLRASSVIATTLLYSFTESEWAIKLTPTTVIFFYYLFTLDKALSCDYQYQRNFGRNDEKYLHTHHASQE
ncbi:MAG: O-antigen ligase family protein [Desulfatirhabdiaceae bacterium]